MMPRHLFYSSFQSPLPSSVILINLPKNVDTASNCSYVRMEVKMDRVKPSASQAVLAEHKAASTELGE